MARIYLGDEEVTQAWAHVGTNITMTRLLVVLSEWHAAHLAEYMKDYIPEGNWFDEREEKHGHIGTTYVRLDTGSSGAWMLERSTGDIYGIKGYGAIDRKKCAGNINDTDFNGSVLSRDRFRLGRFDNRKVSQERTQQP